MKDLDRNEIYDLENIKKDEVRFNKLKDWFKENYKSWTHVNLSNLKYYRYLYYDNCFNEWDFSDSENKSICALTLFEDELIPNTVIDVSQNGANWYKRVLLLIKNNKAICWENAETIEEADKTTCTLVWPYYRNIQPKTVLTKKEIADKFGIDINLLKIKE